MKKENQELIEEAVKILFKKAQEKGLVEKAKKGLKWAYSSQDMNPPKTEPKEETTPKPPKKPKP